MARGKNQRSKAAKQARESLLSEREVWREGWLNALQGATIPKIDSTQVRILANKSMRENGQFVVTEEILEKVVSLIIDQWKGPHDKSWSQGAIEYWGPDNVQWIRRGKGENRKRR